MNTETRLELEKLSDFCYDASLTLDALIFQLPKDMLEEEDRASLTETVELLHALAKESDILCGLCGHRKRS